MQPEILGCIWESWGVGLGGHEDKCREAERQFGMQGAARGGGGQLEVWN